MGFDISRLLLLAPGFLIAITVHEFAHGWVADRLGDPTARYAGRLTLNPIAHLDFFGTLALVLTQMIGWAKPVPVNPYNLEDPRRDMIWISLAGPVSNLLTAIVLAGVVRVAGSVLPGSGLAHAAVEMLGFGVFINLVLAFFNLIPIPPLDGSKILAGVLPEWAEESYSRVEAAGPFLILLLIFVVPAMVGFSPVWAFVKLFVGPLLDLLLGGSL